MRTAIATAVDAPLSLTERDVPEPGPGEVLVRITACGVCFTDLNLLRGHYPFARFPVIPGHEITGVVAAVGPGVSWPEVGTAVGAQFLYDSCGHCDYCARGEQILCPRKRITGIVADGGYAEYAVLKADYVTPLPAGLDPVAAAPADVRRADRLQRAAEGREPSPASRVAVIGAGGMGALAIRYAVAMGARVAVSRPVAPRARSAAKDTGGGVLRGHRHHRSRDSAQGVGRRRQRRSSTPLLPPRPAAATLGGLAPDGTLRPVRVRAGAAQRCRHS